MEVSVSTYLADWIHQFGSPAETRVTSEANVRSINADDSFSNTGTCLSSKKHHNAPTRSINISAPARFRDVGSLALPLLVVQGFAALESLRGFRFRSPAATGVVMVTK